MYLFSLAVTDINPNSSCLEFPFGGHVPLGAHEENGVWLGELSCLQGHL